MSKKRRFLQSMLYAYIALCYTLMFIGQANQVTYKDEYSRNMLELMTAAAPITVTWLIVKIITKQEGK